MTSPQSDEERCPTCGQTRKWHEENAPRHSFGGKVGLTPARPDVAVKAAPWPFDPVLRQALMDLDIPVCELCGCLIGDEKAHIDWHATIDVRMKTKPLMQPENLTAAEAKIRAISGVTQ